MARVSPERAVAYFYCDYKNNKTQNVNNILSAIASQLGRQNEKAFQQLDDYYASLHPRDNLNRSPEIEQLLSVIQSMARCFRDVRIIIDGLDECGDSAADVCMALQTLVDGENAISMALLSRDEIEIRNILYHVLCEHIEIAAQTKDVDHYVRTEMEERMTKGRLRIRNPDLKEEIVHTLVSKAEGMFRWVSCQLDYLSSLPTDALRRKALTELPKTLYETYERILLRVGEPAIPMVRRTLLWLSLANLRLTVAQLREAVSIDDKSDTLDPEARPDVDDILQSCSSLVRRSAHDKGEDEYSLEFAHFTVQEYLWSPGLATGSLQIFRVPKDDFSSIPEYCLRYLTMPKFNTPPPTSLEAFLRLCDEHPLRSFAVTEWNTLRLEGPHSPAMQRMKQLFDPRRTYNFLSFIVHYWIVQFETTGNRVCTNQEYEEFVQDFWAINFRPIHAASLLGLDNICEWLLEDSREVNRRCFLGTPLECAMNQDSSFYNEYGPGDVGPEVRAKTVTVLLRAGADPTIPSSHRWSLSYAAVFAEHGDDIPEIYYDLIRKLIKHGMKVEEDAIDTALGILVGPVLQQVLDVICEVQPDFPATKLGRKLKVGAAAMESSKQCDNALDLSSCFGVDESYLQLLRDSVQFDQLGICEELAKDSRFGPEMKDLKLNGNLLHHAIYHGSADIVKFLITQGFNAADTNDEGLSVLQIAVMNNKEEIVVGMISALCLSAQELNDWLALHICVAKGYVHLIRRLKENGMALDLQSDSGASPLFSLGADSTLETVDLLFKSGVCPDTLDEKGQTALHAYLANAAHPVSERSEERLSSEVARSLITPRSVEIVDARGMIAWELFCNHFVNATTEHPSTLRNIGIDLVNAHAIQAYENYRQACGIDLLITCHSISDSPPKHILSPIFDILMVAAPINHYLSYSHTLAFVMRHSKAYESTCLDLVQKLLSDGLDIHEPKLLYAHDSLCRHICRTSELSDLFPFILERFDSKQLMWKDALGFTLLHDLCRIKAKDWEMSTKNLKVLLDRGISPDLRSVPHSISPLMLAAEIGFAPGIHLLLDRHADPTLTDSRGNGVLNYAIFGDQYAVLRKYFAQIPNSFWKQTCAVNLPKHCRPLLAPSLVIQACTAPMVAVLFGRVQFLDLFEQCAIYDNIHEGNSDGVTPLHLAIAIGDYVCANWLLQHGADPNSMSTTTTSPLHLAVDNGNLDMARLLTNYGARFLRDFQGNTPEVYIAPQQVDTFRALFPEFSDNLEHGRADSSIPNAEDDQDSLCHSVQNLDIPGS